MLIRLGAAEIYAEWRGFAGANAPAAVFLHDGLGSVAAWGDVPDLLCRALGWRGLLYDRRGYGRSSPVEEFPGDFLEREAAALADLLDALGLGRVHLVGHSDGASIALLFAAGHPNRALSLVAEAPHTFVEEITQEGVRRHLVPLLDSPGGTPQWLTKQHGARTAALLRSWTDRWTSPAQAEWDMRDRLKCIRCPILALQGDRDEYATLAQVEAILAHAPKAEARVLPGCGHVPHAERKEEFLTHATRFLGRL